MAKFIQTNISIERKPEEQPCPGSTGIYTKIEEEKLIITLEYVGSGDTSKISNQELLNKIKNLFANII